MITRAASACRFCGCTERDACVVDDGLEVVACHWTDPTRTICSACAPAAKAERLALRARARTYRSMRLSDTVLWVEAFHVGFVAGWFGVTARSRFGRTPRVDARRVDAWQLGRRAGAEASRQYQTVCGPLENAPRRTVLQVTRRARRVQRGGARAGRGVPR